MTEIIPDKSYWLLGILEYASENTEEGGVKGSLKMEKLNVLVRQKMIKMGHEEDNWELMMKHFGPTDPGGLSRMLQKYHLLDIAELEKIRDETIIYKITQKGKKIKYGLDLFFSKISRNTPSIKEKIEREVLEENITRSGNQLVKTPEIQKLKHQEIRGKKI
jgi:hypothetical protein